jgi:hypothetical protein
LAINYALQQPRGVVVKHESLWSSRPRFESWRGYWFLFFVSRREIDALYMRQVFDMIPKIKQIKFRNAHINDNVYTDNDILLFPHSVESVDASRKLTLQDFDRMLLHDPDVAVLGTGFKSKAVIDSAVLASAKKNKIELFVLPTDDAAKKFQELARKGRNVVAKLHITC